MGKCTIGTLRSVLYREVISIVSYIRRFLYQRVHCIYLEHKTQSKSVMSIELLSIDNDCLAEGVARNVSSCCLATLTTDNNKSCSFGQSNNNLSVT